MLEFAPGLTSAVSMNHGRARPMRMSKTLLPIELLTAMSAWPCCGMGKEMFVIDSFPLFLDSPIWPHANLSKHRERKCQLPGRWCPLCCRECRMCSQSALPSRPWSRKRWQSKRWTQRRKRGINSLLPCNQEWCSIRPHEGEHGHPIWHSRTSHRRLQ